MSMNAILKDLSNLQAIVATIVILSMLLPVQAVLQANPILEDAGYVQIKLKEVEIVNQSSTVIHIIHPSEILYILDVARENIKNLGIDYKSTLLTEINHIETKVKTIIPAALRKKRGLINGVGHVYKWLFGIMDNDDREEILEHLAITDQNNHNSITTLNKQVVINQHFNKSFSKLREAVEDDRKQIRETLGRIKVENVGIIRRLIYMDQLEKIRSLESRVDQIQDNIVSAKHNIVHPNIFTAEEIEKYKIDFYKLKLLKIGILSYKSDSLIIAVQIPREYIIAELKLITPLPNGDFLEIEEEDQFIVHINNSVFEYKEDTVLKDLKTSKSCTLRNMCQYKLNNKTQIKEIDDGTLLIKNARDDKLYQNCDNREISISKNYLLVFNNCEVKIHNQSFSNKKDVVQDKFFYPNKQVLNKTDISTPIFSNIITEHFENIKEIKELKFHKTVNYSLGTITVGAIIIVTIVIICLWRQQKKLNIKITNRMLSPKRKEDTLDSMELRQLREKYIAVHK